MYLPYPTTAATLFVAFKVDQPLNFSDLKPHRCDVSVLTNSAKFNAVQLLFSN